MVITVTMAIAAVTALADLILQLTVIESVKAEQLTETERKQTAVVDEVRTDGPTISRTVTTPYTAPLGRKGR